MVQWKNRLFFLVLLAGSACGDAQSAGVTIEEEPTRGMLILEPAQTSAVLQPDSALIPDSANDDNPVLVVDGERLPLTRKR